MEIKKIQEAIRQYGFDGWLMYDFRKNNNITVRIMDLPENLHRTRRFFYFIPADGEPKKLVHRMEEFNLDSLPGGKTVYLSFQSLKEGLEKILENSQKIAMEYSPENNIPYISRVDAGTIEMIRGLGKEVVTSADLVQEFETILTDEQIESHIIAAKQINQFIFNAFDEIGTRIAKFGEIKDSTVQKFLMKRLEEHNLVTNQPPTIGVNDKAGDPHHVIDKEHHYMIRKDDLVLIDMWGKMNKPNTIYADSAWTAYTGTDIPEEYVKAFDAVGKARDAAFDSVKTRFSNGIPVKGWEVDDAARNVITEAGYGGFFYHRTGHSIGEEVHGNGVNMDNIESHDDRRLLPRTCFALEPGIYTNTFGVRSEINVIINEDRSVEITGGEPQAEIVRI
ncbi:M24 family metallopeptidase [candidate division KSB1 bacterium]